MEQFLKEYSDLLRIILNQGCFKRRFVIVVIMSLITISFIFARNEKIIRYEAEGFGYMEIDNLNKHCDVFIYGKFDPSPVKVGSCKIIKQKKSYYKISNCPRCYMFSSSKIIKTKAVNSDTIYITVNINGSTDNYNIIIDLLKIYPYRSFKFENINSKSNTFAIPLNENESVELTGVIIEPVIKDLTHVTSWGDYASMAYYYYGIENEKISTEDILIDFPNFSEETFNQWEINDEYVVKKGSSLIWRNHIFEHIDGS